MNEKEAYIQKWHAKFDQLSEEIDKFMAKAEEAERQTEFQRQVEELQAKRKEIEKIVADLRAAGEEEWTDLKSEIDSAWDSLEDALNRAESRCQ
jgi:uncharacterized coiled-coil DUF342 family protein